MLNQKSQTYCGFNWYFYPGRCANGSISTQGSLLRLETKVAHCNKIRYYINRLFLKCLQNRKTNFFDKPKNLTRFLMLKISNFV